MTLQFQPPPDWLLQNYVNQPNPVQAGSQILEGLSGIATQQMQQKALRTQQQNAALKAYVDAFSAGGPQLATDIGTRMGLKNPPQLPMASSGTVTSPQVNPMAPTGPEEAAQQSLRSEHQGISPLVQASLAAGHPNHSNIQLPGTDDPTQLLNQGAYGEKQLRARESLAKYGDAKASADAKAEENGPKSFEYAKAFAKNAGLPNAADEFITLAQSEGRNTLTKREMSDIKDSINVSAQQGRGQYFGTQAELNKAKFNNELLQQGNKNLNPNAATGPLKPQQERLNRIGRANALVDQMKNQSGGGDTRQMRELATSLATVLTGGNVIAQSQIDELVPQTYKGNALKFFEKLSNNPTGIEQQEFVKRLADTLNREKGTINTQIQSAQNQALPAMGVLKQRDPKGYQQLLDANLNNPAYQNTAQQQAGPHGPTVTQNGNTYTWNGTTYE